MTSVTSLRAEYRDDTGFVAVAAPRLSWKTSTDSADWTQVSAEIEGGADAVTVEGRDSVLVDWPFAPLAAGESRAVRVRVTGSDGETSDWSEPLVVEAGFVDEWTAPLVRAAAPTGIGRPLLVRGTVDLPPFTRAVLFATAQGVYQAEINGTEVDDQILKPGWTAYQHRLTHETTDVTDLLHKGENIVGVRLAGGWFTESFGFNGNDSPFYGDHPAVSVQLRVTLADGSVEIFRSDAAWQTFDDGPVISSSIYDGETFDARKEPAGWSTVGFDASGWAAAAEVAEFPTPSARYSPAVRITDELQVREVITSPSGRTILDFGQNVVGRLRITVTGEAGHTVTLRHAEVLEHGELGLRPLRRAKATDHYTLAGDGPETWEPSFTFHGFRYAEVENWPGEFDPADVTAVVFHSDMVRTGWFDSSHELVNKLHENVVWGMRGNFLYLPTDCPQRDERLGWTGDIQVFSPTASYLYEADGFLASWLEDLALEQKQRDGVVPFIVPDVLRGFAAPAAAWGDAATVVPSVLLERFADRRVLETQYPSMRDWADTIVKLSGERHLWEGNFQFGDWLDPDAPADFPADAKTDADIVATAHVFLSVDLVAKAAAVLGYDEDARSYRSLADTVRTAFRREYVTASGRMVSDAQTAYGMAIQFGLTESDDEKQRMGDRLAALVRAAGYRIGTGFVGTPLVADALTATGHLEVAGRLLTQTENPSWLYPVTMGATTIWERWDSMLEDGSINPGEMTSFNHYALGAIADWMHRSLAGLAPAQPGYRVIRIEPRPLPEFDYATTSHETPYGLASAGWKRVGSQYVVDAVVPPNTTAEVVLPGAAETLTVGSGTHSWTVDAAPAAASTAPLSLDSDLTAIIDDREAYESVLAAIGEVDADAARALRKNTKWVAGRSLHEELMIMSGTVAEAAKTALAGRR
ncbi:alpha-L-rhamnosidase [Conyzicola lurida]|uniref:alpha-L-rhamnosidase n=1 Tax=Conyzicola lurida TaxID=1172621 RepID=A0A841AQJ2_9MICO|nr:alpha-L-rhamnosidase [Conyzicola lurida]